MRTGFGAMVLGCLLLPGDLQAWQPAGAAAVDQQVWRQDLQTSGQPRRVLAVQDIEADDMDYWAPVLPALPPLTRWMALLQRGTEQRLQATTLEPAGPGQAPRMPGLVDSADDQLLYLLEHPSLRAGTVRQARAQGHLAGHDPGQPDLPARLQLGQRTYRMGQDCQRRSHSTEVEGGRIDHHVCALWIEHAGLRQPLGSAWYSAEPDSDGFNGEVRLRWAGDLDGDDRLDLIVDYQRKSCINTWLYLSGSAAAAALAAPVGWDSYCGC